MSEQKETLQIQGMSCGHCVRAVQDALAATSGVQVDEVDIGHAAIRYDAKAVDRDAIREALHRAGYEVVG